VEIGVKGLFKSMIKAETMIKAKFANRIGYFFHLALNLLR